MKRLILTGTALVAFAAVSFAQNTSTVNQNGTSQTAEATQFGNGQISNIQQVGTAATNNGNYAGTFQGASGTPNTVTNTATVLQNDGSKGNRAGISQGMGAMGGNEATISQSNNSGTGGVVTSASTSAADVRAAGGNFAGILQQGSNNTATRIDQNNQSKSNFGEIYQYGTENSRASQFNTETTIEQNGNGTSSSENNESTIRQGTPSAAASYNSAATQQNAGADGASMNNESTVNQAGLGHTANVQQNNNSMGNQSAIRQTNVSGAGNDAYVQQNGAANGASSGNQSDISQNGDYSSASVNQNNNSTGNQAFVSQSGGTSDFNNPGPTATINQTGGPLGSSRNMADVEQAGIGHQATVNQVDDATDNDVYVTQTGLRNIATVLQTAGSKFGEVEIIQGGTANTARAEQYEGTNLDGPPPGANTNPISLHGNEVEIYQNRTTAGGNNIGHIIQGPATPLSGQQGDNGVFLFQEGSYNEARMQQKGSTNGSLIEQNGGSSATVTNKLRGASGGEDSFATMEGVRNVLDVRQTLSDTATAGNNANASQMGNNNRATITQGNN